MGTTCIVQSNLLVSTLKDISNLYFLSEVLAISVNRHSVHELGTE